METTTKEESPRCKGCDHPRPKGGAPTMARTTLSTMTATAGQGCVSCSLLAAGIRQIIGNDPELSEDAAAEQLRLDFNMSGVGRSLEVRLLQPQISLSFFFHQPSAWLQETLPDLSAGFDVPDRTSSEASLAWALDRLKTCKTTHKGCVSSASAALPRRVLDIGTSAHDVIRLYETQGELEPYICLSYCWGPRPLLRTLAANIRSHADRIHLGDLPLTYREAIEFTRKLGICYLWVDSLCIIQDDEEDWRREAANMATIYSNSYLVLLATKASAADGGLFANFPPETRSQRVEFTPEGGSKEEFYVRVRLTHTNTTAARLLQNGQCPAMTRGWIFQERLLSPRMLQFGAEELSWECLQMSACQCSGSRTDDAGPSRALGSTGWLSKMTERFSRAKGYYSFASWASMSPAESQLCWQNLVEDYTRLRLSFEKDVFPALSGLARRFQDATSKTYQAGLWRESFEKDLLWFVEPDPMDDEDEDGEHEGDDAAKAPAWTQRPARWRAPTWSWAAVRGPVGFAAGSEGVESRCEILEVACVPAGVDPSGELASAHILLRGVLIPSSLDYQLPARWPFALLRCGILKGRVGQLTADYDCSRSGSGHLAPGSTVYCFPVAKREGTNVFFLLVLRKVGQDAVRNCLVYERIGLLHLHGGRSPSPSQSWAEYLFSLGEEKVVKIV